MVKIVLERSESSEISSNPGWALVFGRRKVGKTYMIQNFVPHDVYFSVHTDRSVSARGFDVTEFPELATFTEAAKNLLSGGKTVVIDEFQRLPSGLLERLVAVHPNGRLILTGSSMRVTRELLGNNSPLLGFLRPYAIGMVRPSDAMLSLAEQLGPEKAVECAPSLRDPWTIPFFVPERYLENITDVAKYVVPGLVGEVFTEDDRAMTGTYASILSLIGAGYEDYREIANILNTRGLIKSSSSSGVLPYMANMVRMGLLEPLAKYGSKKRVYRIASFPVRLFYFIDSRYGYSERPASWKEMGPAAEGLLRLGIEDFVGDLFSEALGGRKELLKEPEREVDVLVTVRGRPALVAEVKWGKVAKADVSAFLSKVSDFKCRKVLVSREKVDVGEVEVMTPADLVKVAAGVRR